MSTYISCNDHLHSTERFVIPSSNLHQVIEALEEIALRHTDFINDENVSFLYVGDIGLQFLAPETYIVGVHMPVGVTVCCDASYVERSKVCGRSHKHSLAHLFQPLLKGSEYDGLSTASRARVKHVASSHDALYHPFLLSAQLNLRFSDDCF